MALVKENALKFPDKLTACIVLDGDADRLAGIDASGRFINTHNIFSLILHHLVVNRQMTGNVVKTFNLTNLIDKLCAKYMRKLEVTPIGFKYIAQKMLTEDILMGGEESGGMGIKGFIPERDGILAGLNLLELISSDQRTMGQILEELMGQYGYYYYDRFDLHTEKAQAIVRTLSVNPPNDFAKMKVAKVENLDGLKLNFQDESWILFRASGTEPLLRIYAEGRSVEQVRQLLKAGQDLAVT